MRDWSGVVALITLVAGVPVFTFTTFQTLGAADEDKRELGSTLAEISRMVKDLHDDKVARDAIEKERERARTRDHGERPKPKKEETHG